MKIFDMSVVPHSFHVRQTVLCLYIDNLKTSIFSQPYPAIPLMQALLRMMNVGACSYAISSSDMDIGYDQEIIVYKLQHGCNTEDFRNIYHIPCKVSFSYLACLCVAEM